MAKMLEAKQMESFVKWAENNKCVIQVSYPRAGREWLWRLMHRISDKFSMRVFDPPNQAYDDYEYFYWHGYWYREHLTPEARKNIKFAILLRDPRDCALSDAYRRVLTGQEQGMSEQVVTKAVEHLLDREKGYSARLDLFDYSLQIQYERMCLSPIVELQRFIDLVGSRITHPVDIIVRELDRKKYAILVDGELVEKVEPAHFKTGLDRYQASCLKWKQDAFFTEEHNEKVLEALSPFMLEHGYNADGHDLDKIDVAPGDMGVWPISVELLLLIKDLIPPGSEILELGSGFGTGELAKTFKMTSIEHYSGWVGLYDSHYIHAPLVNGWYDASIIRQNVSNGYAALLVDGPSGSERRAKFIDHLNLFDLSKWIIFDDIHREHEYNCFVKLAGRVSRPHFMLQDTRGKAFGIIVPEEEAVKSAVNLSDAYEKYPLMEYQLGAGNAVPIH
jgi:hypothetical protein